MKFADYLFCNIRLYRRLRGGVWELWKFRQEDSCGMEHDNIEWHKTDRDKYVREAEGSPRPTLMAHVYITCEYWSDPKRDFVTHNTF